MAYLRTYEDALALRARLVPGAHVAIIGGGFIGLELAAAVRQRGARVTLIEAAPRILKRGVPEAVAAVIATRHVQAGVALRLGVVITRIENSTLYLADGSAVAADLIVAGIGAAPARAIAQVTEWRGRHCSTS